MHIVFMKFIEYPIGIVIIEIYSNIQNCLFVLSALAIFLTSDLKL